LAIGAFPENKLLQAPQHMSRAFSDLLLRLFVFLGVAIGCITAQAGDDRFGFATHFEQGWPPSPVMQAIASSGVSYIRDDLYAASWETSYVLNAMTGTQVSLSTYQCVTNGNQVSVTNFPISDQPLLIVLQ
jgi:hypothetical protein